jgi:hypothetical protein
MNRTRSWVLSAAGLSAQANDVREELAKSDCNPETRIPTHDSPSRWNRRSESSRLHNANRMAQ